MKFPNRNPALLLIVSGPAGSGKTTLCGRLMAAHPELERVVTCTTRPPRPGEVDGVDYYFLSETQFDAEIETGSFLEYAKVHGSARYGTLRRELHDKLAKETSLLLNIDVQGTATFREAAGRDDQLRDRLVSVFILPPSLQVIRERLQGRGTDDEISMRKRLLSAEAEMTQWPQYDYCIQSGSRDGDFRRLDSILHAERLRVPRLTALLQSNVTPPV